MRISVNDLPVLIINILPTLVGSWSGSAGFTQQKVQEDSLLVVPRPHPHSSSSPEEFQNRVNALIVSRPHYAEAIEYDQDHYLLVGGIKNATVTGNLGFVFEENSGNSHEYRDVMAFGKPRFLRADAVFEYLRFEELLEKSSVFVKD